MKSIEVVVSPEGEVKIEAVGFKGSACSLATKALEQAMGLAGKSSKKPEYFYDAATTQTIGGK